MLPFALVLKVLLYKTSEGNIYINDLPIMKQFHTFYDK